MGAVSWIADLVGKSDGSFLPMVDHATGNDGTFSVWTNGSVEIQFERFVSRSQRVRDHPFATEAQRMELLDRLNLLPGVAIDPTSISRRPNFDLMLLADPEVRRRFLDILDWVVARLRTQGTP